MAILQNETEESAAEKIRTLKELIAENNRIAALGHVAGQGRDVLALIREAEQQMYADKRRYYVETGRDRRAR